MPFMGDTVNTYVEQVIYRYLDCGDLPNGFAN